MWLKLTTRRVHSRSYTRKGILLVTSSDVSAATEGGEKSNASRGVLLNVSVGRKKLVTCPGTFLEARNLLALCTQISVPEMHKSRVITLRYAYLPYHSTRHCSLVDFAPTKGTTP